MRRVANVLGSGRVFFFCLVNFRFAQISSESFSKDFLHQQSGLPVPFPGRTFILELKAQLT